MSSDPIPSHSSEPSQINASAFTCDCKAAGTAEKKGNHTQVRRSELKVSPPLQEAHCCDAAQSE